MNDFEKKACTFVKDERRPLHEGLFASWKPIWDADYAHYRSKPPRNRNPNDSNLFIPKTAEAVEALVPRHVSDLLNAGEPYIRLVGKDPESHERAEFVETVLFSRLEEMDFGLRLLPHVKQGLIYGSTVAAMLPCTETRMVRRRPSFWDKMMARIGMPLDLDEEVPLYDGSVFVPLDLYDYRVDPEATNQENAYDEAYISRRELKQLQAEKARGVPYRNLGDVKEDKEKRDESKEDRRANKPGADDEDRKANRKGVEIYDWFGLYEVKSGRFGKLTWQVCRIMIANDVLILFEVNPFGNGRRPFIFNRFEFDPHEYFGVGLPRVLRSLQKELNALRNLGINAINRIISPMIFYRKSALVNPDQLKDEGWSPFKLIPVRGNENLANILMPVTPIHLASFAQALTETTRLSQEIDNRANMGDLARGLNQQLGGAEMTATEASIKASQIGMRYSFGLKLFQEDCIKKVARLKLEHDQQTWTGERQVRMQDPETGEQIFPSVGAEEIQGDFDFFPVVDPDGAHQAMMRQRMETVIQPLVMLDQLVRQEGSKIKFTPIAEAYTDALKLNMKGPVLEKISPAEQAMEIFKMQMAAKMQGQGAAPASKSEGEVPSNADINQVKSSANMGAQEMGVVP